MTTPRSAVTIKQKRRKGENSKKDKETVFLHVHPSRHWTTRSRNQELYLYIFRGSHAMDPTGVFNESYIFYCPCFGYRVRGESVKTPTESSNRKQRCGRRQVQKNLRRLGERFNTRKQDACSPLALGKPAYYGRQIHLISSLPNVL